MSVAPTFRVCTCLAAIPADFGDGIKGCAKCGELLPGADLAPIIERLVAVEDEVARLKHEAPAVTDKRQVYSIREAAGRAGYSYERFRRIRTRYGFEPRSTTVRAADFEAALRRERDRIA